MMNELRSKLLLAGFKPFTQRCPGHRSAVANYQKRFDDEVGKRYFITVYEYDHRVYPNYPASLNPIDFQFEAQFRQADDLYVDASCASKDAGELPALLLKFELIWVALGKQYYGRFDEC